VQVVLGLWLSERDPRACALTQAFLHDSAAFKLGAQLRPYATGLPSCDLPRPRGRWGGQVWEVAGTWRGRWVATRPAGLVEGQPVVPGGRVTASQRA